MIQTDIFIANVAVVSDVELGRRLYRLPADLKDKDVVRVMHHTHERTTGTQFLPLAQLISTKEFTANGGKTYKRKPALSAQ